MTRQCFTHTYLNKSGVGKQANVRENMNKYYCLLINLIFGLSSYSLNGKYLSIKMKKMFIF